MIRFPFDDFDHPEAHQHLLDELSFRILESKSEDHSVEICLAGGRKTESAAAAMAAQLFGAARVVHVLPLKIGLDEQRSGSLHYSLDRYCLVELPILDFSAATQRILQRRGVTVSSAAQAGEILEEFRRRVPDLAFLEAERVYGPAEQEFRPVKFGNLRTVSVRMKEALERARAVTESPDTVLLVGPTGAGMEFLAREIHNSGSRARHPFIVFSCSDRPDSLLESELLGYVRGAFTGAERDRPGAAERAGEGTLFIDEIDSLTAHGQAVLLRLAADRREFSRVGTDDVQKLKARLIVATNKDLYREVQEGRFRKDLYYRLAVVTIRIPGLSERREDISEIAHALLEEIGRERGLRPRPLTDREIRLLQDHPWPGNVRDLRNALSRWITLSGGSLSEDSLRKAIGESPREEGLRSVWDRAVESLERILRGKARYKDIRDDLSGEALEALILLARAEYERGSDKGSREDWFRRHFELESLDSDLSRVRKRLNRASS
ncbi:MAG: sigma 54-interacting transcriptional regulator [Planctomycetota bacterium]